MSVKIYLAPPLETVGKNADDRIDMEEFRRRHEENKKLPGVLCHTVEDIVDCLMHDRGSKELPLKIEVDPKVEGGNDAEGNK